MSPSESPIIPLPENFKSYSTRPGNKNAHPGKIVQDNQKKRRNPEEVRRAKEEEARRRQAEQAAMQSALQAAADIADELRNEDMQRQHHRGRTRATQPVFTPPSSIPTRGAHADAFPGTEVPNTEPNVSETGMDGGFAGDDGVEYAVATVTTDIDKPESMAENADFVDPVSSGSDDNYEPPQDDGESEVEAEDSSDDDGGLPTKSKQKRVAKPKRSDIDALRKTRPIPTPVPRTLASVTSGSKRPISATSSQVNEPKGKKAKITNLPRGPSSSSSFLPGWDSKKTAYSADSSRAHLSEENVLDEESMVRPGGFAADGEDDLVERHALKGMGKNVKKHFAQNPVTITDTKPATSVHITKKAQRGGRDKWGLQDLPEGCSSGFVNMLTPLAKVKAGMQDPWVGLKEEQVQELVDAVFPGQGHIVEDGDVWSDLVAYRLSNWRTGFVLHAAKAVRNMLEGNKHKFPGGEFDVALFVEGYTKKRGTIPNAPFCWKFWNRDAKTKKITHHGFFQNHLIMYTLAHAHFAEYEDIPDPSDLPKDDLPAGALVLALQAVEHAFKFWKTGVFEADNSLKFSGDLYGDNMVRKPGGPGGRIIQVLERRSGLYMPSAQELKIEKWQEIFSEVKQILEESKHRKRGRSRSASSSRASCEPSREPTPIPIMDSDSEEAGDDSE
ncbi:hypothetical protein CPC08DRAFT_824597 [Agrocybe pediades]|nr:hypothetical protein CPC08DRAFT_824597 [Agrocybe pediades]